MDVVVKRKEGEGRGGEEFYSLLMRSSFFLVSCVPRLGPSEVLLSLVFCFVLFHFGAPLLTQETEKELEVQVSLPHVGSILIKIVSLEGSPLLRRRELFGHVSEKLLFPSPSGRMKRFFSRFYSENLVGLLKVQFLQLSNSCKWGQNVPLRLGFQAFLIS